MDDGYVLIFFENNSANNIAKNLMQHKRTKYIDISHHFL